jgi:hypothetical protein
MPPLELVEYGIPAVLAGLLIGYAIGGSWRLSLRERVCFGVTICFLGGLMLSFLMSAFMPVTTQTVLFGMISFAGGYAFATIYHWSPLKHAAPERHVVFEPEDDEEFDREIDKAFHHEQ